MIRNMIEKGISISDIARILHLGELLEVYHHSTEIDDLRSMARYRKSIGEEITE